ncbi:hypothetical protein EDD30_7611 [Couchioplanes caeruleus]|uniref:Uncharacterized protein n=1 Tax=Couchioplanes caeruleus TaxID=56438 RepID=A0A3N1FT76_9ACTN|nr:hypothetical protein EDD30_7611 [Couchioplanes caeruleus]
MDLHRRCHNLNLERRDRPITRHAAQRVMGKPFHLADKLE